MCPREPITSSSLVSRVTRVVFLGTLYFISQTPNVHSRFIVFSVVGLFCNLGHPKLIISPVHILEREGFKSALFLRHYFGWYPSVSHHTTKVFALSCDGRLLVRHLYIVKQVVHFFFAVFVLRVFFDEPGAHFVFILAVSIDIFAIGFEGEAIVGLQLAFLVVE